METFKKPSTYANADNQLKIKQEKETQENLKEEKPRCRKTNSDLNIPKIQNPLLSSDEHDTEDDGDCMPKPFLIKQEFEIAKDAKKVSIKKRFNVDCEHCEKVSFILNIFVLFSLYYNIQMKCFSFSAD